MIKVSLFNKITSCILVGLICIFVGLPLIAIVEIEHRISKKRRVEKLFDDLL